MASAKRKPSAERRLEIIETAQEILVSEGFHKLTLRNVAKKVGIKLASLQYHYSNRAVLVKAVFEQATAHYDSKITKFLSMDLTVQPKLMIAEGVKILLDDHKSEEENQFFYQIMAMAVEEKAAQEVIDDYYQKIWTMSENLLLQFNPSLDQEERINRSAQIISMVDGCVFFIGSKRLHRKLPDSFYEQIQNWVVKLVFE